MWKSCEHYTILIYVIYVINVDCLTPSFSLILNNKNKKMCVYKNKVF